MVSGSDESLAIAGIFSTYPNPHLYVGQDFLVETVITAILMCLILALIDDGNGIPRGPLAPLLIGSLIAIISASTGPLTGFVLNPARDPGPKLLAYLAGWGKVAFTGARDIPYFLVVPRPNHRRKSGHLRLPRADWPPPALRYLHYERNRLI